MKTVNFSPIQLEIIRNVRLAIMFRKSKESFHKSLIYISVDMLFTCKLICKLNIITEQLNTKNLKFDVT